MTEIDVYARVSRMSDKRDLSTNGQVSECKQLVADAGYQVGKVHVDSSKSAWNTKVFRPGWEALMTRLEAGLSGGVIVFELSRFARRAEDGLRLLRLAQAGAIVIDSENEYDLTRPREAKNFRDAISAAEYESDMISLRTRRGKRNKVRELKIANTSTRAFGFELGNVVPREDEAAELVAAAQKLVAKVKAQHICDDLNARGVLTTLGNPWLPRTLKLALMRPANVGDIVFQGKVEHVGVNPGIMTRELYDQVVALYGGRKRGRPVVNLGSGFVLCAGCRRPMHAKELGSRNTPYPDGTPAKVYICVKRHGVGCHQCIDWRDLDDYLREVALQIVADPGTAAAIEQQAAAVDAELGPVLEKITELQATRDGLDERLGQLGLERWEKLTKPLDEQLAKLEAQRAHLAANAPDRALVAQKASRATWDKRWAKADIDGKREIVRQAFRGRRLLVSAGPRLQPAHERCRFDVELAS